MVEYWQKLFCGSRYTIVENKNCDYNMLADCYGIENLYPSTANPHTSITSRTYHCTIELLYCIFVQNPRMWLTAPPHPLLPRSTCAVE